MLFPIRNCLFSVAVAMLTLSLSGCGGESEPVPITDDVQQQIEQEEQQVLDEESEL